MPWSGVSTQGHRRRRLRLTGTFRSWCTLALSGHSMRHPMLVTGVTVTGVTGVTIFTTVALADTTAP